MQADPNWRDEARRLRDEGLKPREIEKRLGKSPKAVWRALNPEKVAADNLARREYKREWDRRDAERRSLANRILPDREYDPGIPGLIPVWSQMREIIDFARVDIADWEAVRHMRFSLTLGYASTAINNRRVYLHHLIQPIPGTRKGGRQCDHINRDKMDNRRCNLRIVTPKENCANRGGKFEQLAA